MTTTTQPRRGFLRHFISGFALGAVALVGVQVADRAHAQGDEAIHAVGTN